jgi:selenide,water dikinase
MKRLNRNAAQAALKVQASSMTDVTGFGLLGHAQEMAAQSGVDFVFELPELRWLPGTVDYGKSGSFPGGMGRNLDYFSPWVSFDQSVSKLYQDLLWTPETSGGLLIAMPPGALEPFQELCQDGVRVGYVQEGEGRIHVRS